MFDEPTTPVSATTTLQNTFQNQHQQHDPEALTVAHRRYLASLAQSLFLTEIPFTRSLRSLLTSIDHLIALVTRLETIQRNLDLETDEGVVDALADYTREEKEIWHELRETRDEVERGIREVVMRLRDIDDSRSGEGRRMFDLGNNNNNNNGNQNNSNSNNHGPRGLAEPNVYVPRKAAGVDRLLMKLDFGSLNSALGGGAEEPYSYPPRSRDGVE